MKLRELLLERKFNFKVEYETLTGKPINHMSLKTSIEAISSVIAVSAAEKLVNEYNKHAYDHGGKVRVKRVWNMTNLN